MNEEFLKPSSNPDIWCLAAMEINDALLLVDMAAARRAPSADVTEREAEAQRQQAVEPVRKLFAAVNQHQWGFNRAHYTYGQLNTDGLVLMAERRIVDWQTIFNAKAAFGTAEDLAEIAAAAALNKGSINLNTALPHAAKPLLLATGLQAEGNYETAQQLFKMGADPNTNNGQLFMETVDGGRGDIGRLFAKHGQHGLLDINPLINTAKAQRKLKLYEDLRKIHWEYGRFAVLDHETLLETKTLPDNAGAIKIMFNFAAQRVNEIFETVNPRQSIMKEYPFAEYGEAALDAAREKLIDMGGRPSGIELPMRGKSALAKPVGQKQPGLQRPEGN
ncbi:MAG: hypothetical protein PW788_02420 [Micavibrio sp.]|nr:hypothetical protein [Micavibrio sp.]